MSLKKDYKKYFMAYYRKITQETNLNSMKTDLEKLLKPTLKAGKETDESKKVRIKFGKDKFNSLINIGEEFKNNCKTLNMSILPETFPWNEFTGNVAQKNSKLDSSTQISSLFSDEDEAFDFKLQVTHVWILSNFMDQVSPIISGILSLKSSQSPIEEISKKYTQNDWGKLNSANYSDIIGAMKEDLNNKWYQFSINFIDNIKTATEKPPSTSEENQEIKQLLSKMETEWKEIQDKLTERKKNEFKVADDNWSSKAKSHNDAIKSFGRDLSPWINKSYNGGIVTKVIIDNSVKVFPKLKDICKKFKEHLTKTNIIISFWNNPSDDTALKLSESVLPTKT